MTFCNTDGVASVTESHSLDHMKLLVVLVVALATVSGCEWPSSRIGHPEPGCDPCGTINLTAPIPGPF